MTPLERKAITEAINILNQDELTSSNITMKFHSYLVDKLKDDKKALDKITNDENFFKLLNNHRTISDKAINWLKCTLEEDE
jgi:hypothetical protein